jgi:flagellar hook assembly protein FlgD
LRKLAAALAVVALLSFGVAVPPVGAAVGDPKVVIIVGATHGATAGYRSDADVVYNEARKYTSNVSRVYSPYATWAAVQKAVVGASIVVYLGHGNGWPSPYTYDPNYTTKDGFGLNASWGDGDYNNKYYGEPYVASLKMAPGAIVILSHLCYASGNSEPGNPEPTVTVARQRADNYAAGFLKAGASAVLADGHSGAERYIRDLFTTHRTLDAMFHDQSNANGNFVRFASARTPGATVTQDPETPTTGFYRSLTTATFGVTTDEVVSAGYGDTSVDPTALTVPGNAEVTTDGAGIYGDLGTLAAPTTTVPVGTRLRVTETAAQTTAEGTPLVEVQGIDDPSIVGYMAVSDLTAKDSAAPLVRALDVGVGRFSPNGDGQGDKASIRARFTESVAWTLQVKNGGGSVLWQTTGTGSQLDTTWDGIVSGKAVADGTYTVALSGVDAWKNGPGSSSRSLVTDTVAPSLSGLTPGADPVPWFSPNGDAYRDTVAWTASNSETGSLRVQVRNAGGTIVRTFSVTSNGAPATATWDGRTNAGAYAPDGTYTVTVAPVDLAGNVGAGQARKVQLVAALRAVLTSKGIFFPQDGDALAPNTKLQFTLQRPMTVTWTLRNAAGATVITRLAGSSKPAGSQYWIFDGRATDGKMLPRGRYTSVVTATDGTLTASQSVSFDSDAFTVTPSDTTPGRGQSITVTIVTAETLKSTPTLWIYQPGVAAWSTKPSKTGTYTYKATIRLKSAGSAGQLSLKAWGVDTAGQAQATTKVFQLH